MKILVIQHDAADPAAAAGDVAVSLGHELEFVKIDRSDQIPEQSDADALMTFGGGVSLTQKKSLPDWVAAEQQLIRDFVDSGRRVFAICAGAQLTARALGAGVRRNEEPEVGWHPVQLAAGIEDVPEFLGEFAEPQVVFHWHQDTFGIPDGATCVLSSTGCANQGFVIGDHVLALQFHLEANERTVQAFLAVSQLWRQSARFVQTEQEIQQGIRRHLPHQQQMLMRMLTSFLGHAT